MHPNDAETMSRQHERTMENARKLIPVLNWSEAERIANLPDQIQGTQSVAVMNTDRELFREIKDDYYAPSCHVTEQGSIGINVGGYVIVMPLREWHKLADDRKRINH